MSELSNAPLFVPQVQPTSIGQDLNALPTSFSTGVNEFNNNAQADGGGILTYPADIPKYYITFAISQYQRADLSSIGEFRPAQDYPAIVMPLPSPLIDNLEVDWREVEIGTLPGAITNAGQSIAPGIQGLGLTAGVAALAGGAGALASGGGNAGAIGAIIGGAVGGVRDPASAVLGVSLNQFVTMLMRGPKYKRHQFVWQLSPNNIKDSQNLQQIITAIKNASSPNYYSLSAGSINFGPVLWQFPKIFHVRLYPNSQWLYKFKPCICDHFAVNYTPGGRASFYHDQLGGGNDNLGTGNPPGSVTIQMRLIELEYWTEGNFTNSNDPDDVYANSSSVLHSTTVDNLVGQIPGLNNGSAQNSPSNTPTPNLNSDPNSGGP